MHLINKVVGDLDSMTMLQGLQVECVGMPMHLVNKLGRPDSPEERFVDVFAGGALLTRCGCTA